MKREVYQCDACPTPKPELSPRDVCCLFDLNVHLCRGHLIEFFHRCVGAGFVMPVDLLPREAVVEIKNATPPPTEAEAAAETEVTSNEET